MSIVRGRWLLGARASIAPVAVFAIIGYPLAELLYQSVAAGGHFGLEAYAPLLQRQTGVALAHTLNVSLLVTAFSTFVGVLMAALLHRSNLPLRRLIGVLLLLPLLTPPFVQALAWLGAYARGGLTFHWLGYSAEWLEGGAGIVLLLTVQTCPLVYLLVGSLLSSQRSADLEEAARAAGSGQWRTLRDVTLPLLAPGIVAACLIGLVSAASDFGIPAVLGIPGGYTVVTTLIYRQLSFASGPGALGEVVALSTLLAILAVMALLLAVRLTRARTAAPPLARRHGPGVMIRLGKWRWPLAAGLVLVLTGAAGLPLLALVLQALERGFAPSLTPSDWTIVHFQAALSRGGLHALAISLALAATAGAIVAIWGLALALPAARGHSILRIARGLASVPFALPGSVVAVAAILAWQRWFYGTLAIILLAYVGRFAIFGVRAAEAAFSSVPVEMEEAARSSGASAFRAAIEIQRPLVQPALMAAFALVFLLAVHELTISSLLYTPGNETIAVSVLNTQQAGDIDVTAALAVIVTGITLLAAVPLAFSSQIRRLIDVEPRG